MPRYVNEIAKKFLGDPALAAQYVTTARKLLGGLYDLTGEGVLSNSRKVTLGDGAVITVAFYGAANLVQIDVRNVVSPQQENAEIVFLVDSGAVDYVYAHRVGGPFRKIKRIPYGARYWYSSTPGVRNRLLSWGLSAVQGIPASSLTAITQRPNPLVVVPPGIDLVNSDGSYVLDNKQYASPTGGLLDVDFSPGGAKLPPAIYGAAIVDGNIVATRRFDSLVGGSFAIKVFAPGSDAFYRLGVYTQTPTIPFANGHVDLSYNATGTEMSFVMNAYCAPVSGVPAHTIGSVKVTPLTPPRGTLTAVATHIASEPCASETASYRYTLGYEAGGNIVTSNEVQSSLGSTPVYTTTINSPALNAAFSGILYWADARAGVYVFIKSTPNFDFTLNTWTATIVIGGVLTALPYTVSTDGRVYLRAAAAYGSSAIIHLSEDPLLTGVVFEVVNSGGVVKVVDITALTGGANVGVSLCLDHMLTYIS
jgi:hypothetical protein